METHFRQDRYDGGWDYFLAKDVLQREKLDISSPASLLLKVLPIHRLVYL